MRPPEHRFFEDFALGQQFESGKSVMDAAGIKAFASAFDPQPFHLDESAARESLFRGLAASGWHTAATTMRLAGKRRTTPGSMPSPGTSPSSLCSKSIC